MSEDKNMSQKYLFDKLLEREDKFLSLIEKLDDSITNLTEPLQGIKTLVISHETATAGQRESCNKSHDVLKDAIETLKKGDRSLINSAFKVAFGVFVLLAIGKEIFGAENIILFVKWFFHVQ